MEPVLVTADKRGVFFGYIAEMPPSCPAAITLRDARNCVYWTTETHGVFGLAAKGPGPGCRIGPKVPTLHIVGVTSVAECTPEAAARWGEETWG